MKNNDWRIADRIKVNGIEGIGYILHFFDKEYIVVHYVYDKAPYYYTNQYYKKSSCINLSSNGRKTARTTKRNEKGKYMKKSYSRRQENDIFDNKVTEIENIPDPASMPFEHNEQVRYYFNKMIEWNNELAERIKKLEDNVKELQLIVQKQEK
jgi:hypothetical protein